MTDAPPRHLIDRCQRRLNYLRISVTDRCNLRCAYCLPSEEIPRLRHADVLRYEEIPAAHGALYEAAARLLNRQVEAAIRPPEPRFLTVDQASEVSGYLPKRRIYSLARNQPWAVRIGRTLRVEENGFRRWLLTAGVREAHEPAGRRRKAS